MPPKGLSQYKENAVTTQSPGQIVVLLYEGAIRFLRQAIDAIEQENWIEKGVKINKAIDIISELNAALDEEKGGEVAKNLRSLYLFMNQHLLQANVRKDAEMIQQVIDQLNTLLDGWKQIAA
jgi:flagellar protein FliS